MVPAGREELTWQRLLDSIQAYARRSWGDKRLDRLRGTLIPDAKAKGYWWGKN